MSAPNEKPNQRWNGRLLTIIVTAVIALFSGGGASYMLLRGMGPELESLARPDPFTGTEGLALLTKINELQRQIDALPPRQLERDVAWCRQEIGHLRDEMDEHKDKHHEDK